MSRRRWPGCCRSSTKGRNPSRSRWSWSRSWSSRRSSSSRSSWNPMRWSRSLSLSRGARAGRRAGGRVEPEVPEEEESGLMRGPRQGQGHDARRGHAGHGDRGGRRPDLGPAAFPFRHGPAERSRCASAHVSHSALTYSKFFLYGTFSVGYETNGLSRCPRSTLPRQHEGHLKPRDGICQARRPDRPSGPRWFSDGRCHAKPA